MADKKEFDYKKHLRLIEKRKRLFIITALSIMAGAVIIGYVLPKKFEARSTVFIEKNIIGDLVKGLAVTASMEDTIKVLTYAISSRTLITKVINELDLNNGKQNDARLEATIADLRKRTDVKLKDKEGLFIISFEDENPVFARDYVNTLVRRYIEDNVSTKREESYGAANFLSEQIASFKAKMDKAEAELEKFKREKGALIAMDERSMLGEINANRQRLDDLVMRRAQLESSLSQLKKSNPAANRLISLRKKLEELRVEYTDDYPEVVKIKADIESAGQESGKSAGRAGFSDPHEVERLESELRAVRSSEANQRAILDGNRMAQREGPSLRSALEKLEQERNNSKNIYEQLVARHGQAEVSKQMEVQDKATTFRIVDPAVTPIRPVSPNRVKIILFGILAGLGGGIGLLTLLDRLDHSVKSPDTLKELGRPVLAMIPRIETQEDIMKKKKEDARLYKIAAACFSLVLLVLVIEAIELPYIETMFDNLSGMPVVDSIKGFFR